MRGLVPPLLMSILLVMLAYSSCGGDATDEPRITDPRKDPCITSRDDECGDEG